MKNISLLIVFLCSISLVGYSQCDTLNRFNEKELMKLSNQVYELEKKDSLANATEPNGFGLKDLSSISDPKLLIDVIGKDSTHDYSDKEAIALSKYIYELEKRDSLNKSRIALRAAAAAAEAAKPPVKEFALEEAKEIKTFAKQIFFHTNSATLTEDSYKPLDDILKILTSYINLNFIIEGYTDAVGSDEYNLALSKRRAKTIREYFISKGIPAARIASVTGYGETKPIGSNETEEGKAMNRRVEIKAVH
jgi:outer membrane protein OmpA-like peptidoglycan-associated protein